MVYLHCGYLCFCTGGDGGQRRQSIGWGQAAGSVLSAYPRSRLWLRCGAIGLVSICWDPVSDIFSILIQPVTAYRDFMLKQELLHKQELFYFPDGGIRSGPVKMENICHILSRIHMPHLLHIHQQLASMSTIFIGIHPVDKVLPKTDISLMMGSISGPKGIS